jgi:hypothetical protein
MAKSVVRKQTTQHEAARRHVNMPLLAQVRMQAAAPIHTGADPQAGVLAALWSGHHCSLPQYQMYHHLCQPQVRYMA